MTLFEIRRHPDESELRFFGEATTAALGVVGAWAFFAHAPVGVELSAVAAQVVGVCLWAAGVLCLALAVAAPRTLRPVYVGLSWLAAPLGLAISLILLAILFYAVLTPVALVFRAMGRDALALRKKPGAATYWTPREPANDVERYFRQF